MKWPKIDCSTVCLTAANMPATGRDGAKWSEGFLSPFRQRRQLYVTTTDTRVNKL